MSFLKKKENKPYFDYTNYPGVSANLSFNYSHQDEYGDEKNIGYCRGCGAPIEKNRCDYCGIMNG